MNTVRKKAGDLRCGQLVWLAGMVMQLSHWNGETPVFRHFRKANDQNPDVNYINHNINKQTIITVL
jgi:hypothetical protein